jgi:hypothetical protein
MKKLIILLCLFFPSVALAQYYSPPPPSGQFGGGFHNRTGRLIFGGSIGASNMSSRGSDLECRDYDYSPIGLQVAGHIGGFLSPRFALMGELQGNFQTLSSDSFTGDTTTLVQGALMLAAQYWVTPRLWIKGGLGFATMQVDRSYFGDGIVDESTVPENGTAIMGAIGYELLSARNFSIDVQGRLLNGAYKGIDDNITAGSIGIGINWF